ncbi:hypothetical protein [Methylocaldum gracile]|uniref:hypothetical protein n=1 Tax=Methylocaldum sp. 0917 TaxID=2485163 RepID=UPI00105B8442
MNKIGQFGVAGLFLIVGGMSDVSAEEMPKVFRDAPAQKGQWRMEILKFDGGEGGGEAVSAMPKSMSMCMDSIMDMAKNSEQQQGPSTCRGKILENKDDRAVYEATCEGGDVYRSTITREGPRSFLIEADGKSPEGSFAMTSRYTYEGPCKGNGGQPAISFDKNSEACKAMKARMSQMDPKKACAGATGEARRTCEQQMAQSLAQMKGMCE